MIFFILNTFLVFELNEKFNFTYEHTCRIASIVHALFCFAGSTLYLTDRITLEHRPRKFSRGKEVNNPRIQEILLSEPKNIQTR